MFPPKFLILATVLAVATTSGCKSNKPDPTVQAVAPPAAERPITRLERRREWYDDGAFTQYTD
jgi:hypothetical protein